MKKLFKITYKYMVNYDKYFVNLSGNDADHVICKFYAMLPLADIILIEEIGEIED